MILKASHPIPSFNRTQSLTQRVFGNRTQSLPQKGVRDYVYELTHTMFAQPQPCQRNPGIQLWQGDRRTRARSSGGSIRDAPAAPAVVVRHSGPGRPGALRALCSQRHCACSVYWNKQRRMRKAKVRRGCSNHHIGYYDDEVAAARAVDQWMLANGEGPVNLDADDTPLERQSTYASIYTGVSKNTPGRELRALRLLR
jgi:hypothetical protein